MASAIPEVLISQVLDKLDAKFQMLHPHFRCPASQWSCHQHCGIKPAVKNKDGGRHIWFLTYGLIPQYKQQLHWEAGPQQCGCSTWNFVSISPRSWDISTSCFWPPCWISDFRFHPTVMKTTPLKSLTPKMGGSFWNFVSISSRSGDMPGGKFYPLSPFV